MTHAIITVTLNTAIDRVVEVPHLALGSHVVGRRLRRYPAGKGINVSRALATLGQTSAATGLVGRDELGLYRQFLADSTDGRCTCELIATGAQTRENITLLDPASTTETHIRERGDEVTPADIQRITTRISELVTPSAIVTICGSLPPGFDLADLRKLIQAAQTRGARIALDLDGRVLRDLLACRSDAPPLTSLWLIKPNLSELAEVIDATPPDDPAALAAFAAPLCEHADTVVVTCGPRGAILITADHAWYGNILLAPDRAQHTVGCGDCMLAGLLHAAARNLDPPAHLRRGLAVAAANLRNPGAATFSAADVSVLEPQAHIERLALPN